MPWPKGKPAWNKGKTKKTDLRVMKYSNSLAGRKFTDKHKANLSRTLSDGRLKGANNPNWKGGLISFVCKYCSKEFFRKRKDLKSGRGKYCSKKCMNDDLVNVMQERYKKNPSLKNNIIRYGKDNWMYGKLARHGKGEYFLDRKHRKIWMRSTWEIKFAKWLDSNELDWEYECTKFELNCRTYAPDFYVKNWNCYIEIKGWIKKETYLQMDEFKIKYPKIELRLYGYKELKKLGILK